MTIIVSKIATNLSITPSLLLGESKANVAFNIIRLPAKGVMATSNLATFDGLRVTLQSMELCKKAFQINTLYIFISHNYHNISEKKPDLSTRLPLYSNKHLLFCRGA